MTKFILVFILFTILPRTILAQQAIRKNCKGKVIANANDLEGIYIINLQNKNSVTTDNGGYFSITAQVGDTLMLSSIRFKGMKYTITETDLCKELFFVKMQILMIPIDEVTVFQYKNINAVTLGIIPKGQKSYTPAERKYNTASNPYINLNMDGTAGASIGTDPIFNFLSGRTAMLKKEVEVEKKEFLIQKIANLFELNYFINKLKIPEEYVKGFQYYLAENYRFATILKERNKTMVSFIMGELAVNYLEIIASEKK
jgi:hypothetical protein